MVNLGKSTNNFMSNSGYHMKIIVLSDGYLAVSCIFKKMIIHFFLFIYLFQDQQAQNDIDELLMQYQSYR